ncbi:TPA: hypothetical protein MIV73_17420 [Klebsiella pneumoniae]|nr:hypothetical protein [Klebsiella pneumoniae]
MLVFVKNFASFFEAEDFIAVNYSYYIVIPLIKKILMKGKTAVSTHFTPFVMLFKQAKALVKTIHHISKSMSPHVLSGWFPFYDGDSISDGMRKSNPAKEVLQEK